MNTIQSEFQKHGIKKKHHKRKKKKQRKEKFSEGDMRFLMGTNRPTYKRHKGAFRQK